MGLLAKIDGNRIRGYQDLDKGDVLFYGTGSNEQSRKKQTKVVS